MKAEFMNWKEKCQKREKSLQCDDLERLMNTWLDGKFANDISVHYLQEK